MNPDLAALDRALSRAGETITLRRPLGTSPITYRDVQVRAHVRGFNTEDLTGAITQVDSKVIMSPSEITAANWPGPPKKGDKVIIDGRTRNVEAVFPIYASNELVRIEMRVRG